MNEQHKYKFKRILHMALWTMAGGALFVLLLSAMHRNSKLACSGLDILIEGYNDEMFISDAEVKRMLEVELSHKLEGSSLEQLDLRKLERSLQKNPWISKAQLFVDNQQLLHINISERMPVARVFTRSGQSFYMDSSAVVLPLSAYETADVPVFTNVPDGPYKLNVTDSMVWKQVSCMGNFIKKDSFLLMQLGQIDVLPDAAYAMYPAIGNHVIEFGTANNYEKKLQRLSTFYKRIFGKVGLNKYEVIDLRYEKQIVATLRGKPEGKIDSAAAMRKFEELVNKTVREANDTTVKLGSEKNNNARQEILIPRSLQPVDGSSAKQKAVEQVTQEEPAQEQTTQEKPKQTAITPTPSQNKSIIKTQNPKPMVQQPANKPKPTVIEKNQPKAVMPKKNDY